MDLHLQKKNENLPGRVNGNRQRNQSDKVNGDGGGGGGGGSPGNVTDRDKSIHVTSTVTAEATNGKNEISQNFSISAKLWATVIKQTLEFNIDMQTLDFNINVHQCRMDDMLSNKWRTLGKL